MLNDMTERIMVAAPGGRRPLSFGGGEPLLNSKATPWAGITFEVHRITSFEGAGESGPLDDESGLLVMLDGQVEIVRRDGKRELSEPAAAGRVDFLDGQHRPNLLRMKGDGEAAAFQLSKEWFRRLLLEDVPRGFGLRAPILAGPASVSSSGSGAGLGRVLDASALLGLRSPPSSEAGLASSAQPPKLRAAITSAHGKCPLSRTALGACKPRIASFLIGLLLPQRP
ncbi:MAG: hypothetical protein RLZZ450_5555 [Pseudomonadota bacterium]|jgi:hypothetical protein